MPQVPVLQLEAGALLNENELPPETLEAKVEIFFFTLALRQAGQTTSSIELLLRTSSSNDLLQSAHTNSKMGMIDSSGGSFSRHLDAGRAKRLQRDLPRVLGSLRASPSR
jgi:hypothetical protein